MSRQTLKQREAIRKYRDLQRTADAEKHSKIVKFPSPPGVPGSDDQVLGHLDTASFWLVMFAIFLGVRLAHLWGWL